MATEKGISLSGVCRQLGYSKQAYYQSLSRKRAAGSLWLQIKQKVLAVRHQLPRLGTRNYKHGDNLEASTSQQALEMAFKQRFYREPLIHHSDRGLQYCSRDYTRLLKAHHVSISMTQNGSPYDNAIAERINGILKQEFGLDEVFENMQQADKQINESIRLYNSLRPHLSNHYLTPDQMHCQQQLKPRTWHKKTTRKDRIPDGSLSSNQF